ncbi:hypothetical protein NLX83_26770 [Allokutzneria sp. A3M-2-11 16]|uniref:hypothetical protein n=1 Tax=Allokutzneria sp. A3M-2-11 16 TaxID=2962043 RepID=UPI0020B88CA5|nr:hypothetical protein [Allokutzneria sp. A3M-2-11 16]MCP3802884.1 hypothetical protein [Allokutzneria sp. A3M-2-11 16]
MPKKTALKRLGAAASATVAALGMVFVLTPSAQADGEWCNNQTCIRTYDTGTYLGRVEVSVWTQNRAGTTYAKVWTTNGWSQTTRSEYVDAFRTYRGQVYPQRHFPNQTRLCAEGYKSGGKYGLPCVTLVG